MGGPSRRVSVIAHAAFGPVYVRRRPVLPRQTDRQQLQTGLVQASTAEKQFNLC